MSSHQTVNLGYVDGLSKQDVIRFREEAEQARDRATSAIDIDKEAWLLMAEDWLKLARAVEARLSAQ
jgi:hypothetical protein